MALQPNTDLQIFLFILHAVCTGMHFVFRPSIKHKE